MTTSAMPSICEFEEHTTTSDDAIQLGDGKARVDQSNVFNFSAYLGPITAEVLPPNSVDIDDLVAEFEADPSSRKSISDGRKWVAENYYAEGPVTLRALRLRRGMSQAQLASDIGTSQSHIARIEMGPTNVMLSTLRRLCAVLHVDMNTLTSAMPS